MPFFSPSRAHHTESAEEGGAENASAEETEDFLSVDAYLIENKEASYMLRMAGNSMADEGILDGDILIVERGKVAESGDVAVIHADGEFVLKKMSNQKMMTGGAAVELIGTVVGLMRKY